jgi:hypothetical protein
LAGPQKGDSRIVVEQGVQFRFHPRAIIYAIVEITSINAYIMRNQTEINVLQTQGLPKKSLSAAQIARISARSVGQARLLNGSGVLLRYEEIN